jgi:cysteine protease ATG4
LQGRELDIKIGDWFGPSTISQGISLGFLSVVFSTLSSRAEIGFNLTVAMDGVVYRNMVETPGLILVPLLLGSGKELNPIYQNAVKSLFNIPQCVGLAGGRPNSSLYFIG